MWWKKRRLRNYDKQWNEHGEGYKGAGDMALNILLAASGGDATGDLASQLKNIKPVLDGVDTTPPLQAIDEAVLIMQESKE